MGDHLFLHYAKSKPFDRRKISSKRFWQGEILNGEKGRVLRGTAFFEKRGTGMAGPSRPPKKSLSPAAAFSGLIGAGKTVSNCTGML